MVAKDRFVTLTDIVIDNFEGGYYHPDMKKRMKASDQRKIGDSGETMFGLDRKHGAALAKYPEWKQFWAMIDNAGARTKWPHYYRGGALEKPLKVMAAKIMYNWFIELANKYLNEKAKAAIAKDDRLVIHFSYASWNGPGWFEKFAKGLNAVLNLGILDTQRIYEAAIKSRTNSGNSVINQHGNKMVALFNKLYGGTEKKKLKPFIDAFDWFSWNTGG